MDIDAEIHNQALGPSSRSPAEEREEGLYESGGQGRNKGTHRDN